MQTRRCLVTGALLAVSIALSGCAYVAHTDVDVHGRKVSSEELARLKTGETTSAQLIAMLGTPTGIHEEEAGVEVLSYDYRETVEKSSAFVLIWATHSKRVTGGTVKFRLRDDVLVEYWSEGSIKLTD